MTELSLAMKQLQKVAPALVPSELKPAAPAPVDSAPVPVVTPPVVAAPPPPVVVDPLDEPLVTDDSIDDDIPEPTERDSLNFKKTRTKLKAIQKDYFEIKQKHEETAARLKDYEEGLAVPEYVQKQTDRIAYLEQFEQLHNFKGSAVYQEKFAKPINEEMDKLSKIAEVNKVSSAVVKAAADMEGPELDRLLSQHFPNTLTAFEVKQSIQKIQSVHSESLEAEKEPAKSIARLQQENDRILQERQVARNAVIAAVSRSAWMESVAELREDDRFPELKNRTGDTEYNETVVRPILVHAGQDYGRLVKSLAAQGIAELPKDEAKAIARSFQLARVSAAIAVERDELRKENANLTKQLNEIHRVQRPGVNSNGGASVSTSKSTGSTAMKLLQQVGYAGK